MASNIVSHYLRGQSTEAGILKKLKSRGFDDKVVDVEGINLLHAAAHRGHAKVARVLLDRSIPIDGVTDAGATPLVARLPSGPY
jgi:ankyrin repeat protein